MPVRELGLSDRDLMIRFYHGDSQAFDLLTQQWRPRLLRFFRTLGFGCDDAEDLTQQTLIKLYLTKETFSFDLSQPLAPFLYTIARNKAIEWWRPRKNHPETLFLIDPLADDEAGASGHRERIEAAPPPVSEEMMTDLWDCISSLPETEQTYICLCERHGLGELSHNDIAGVLGKRHPAEITRISQRAREHLCACMVSKGYGRNLSLPVKEDTECLR